MHQTIAASNQSPMTTATSAPAIRIRTRGVRICSNTRPMNPRGRLGGTAAATLSRFLACALLSPVVEAPKRSSSSLTGRLQSSMITGLTCLSVKACHSRRASHRPGSIGSQKVNPRNSNVADSASATSTPPQCRVTTSAASNAPSHPEGGPTVMLLLFKRMRIGWVELRSFCVHAFAPRSVHRIAECWSRPLCGFDTCQTWLPQASGLQNFT